MGFSSAQLSRRASQLRCGVQAAYATTIVVDGETIAAARSGSGSGSESEPGGFLAIADITIHVLRSLIPNGITFVPNKTILTEGGVEYRVAGTRGSIHDPAIILDCKAT